MLVPLPKPTQHKSKHTCDLKQQELSVHCSQAIQALHQSEFSMLYETGPRANEENPQFEPLAYQIMSGSEIFSL